MPHGSKGVVVDILELSRENGDELKAGVNKSIRVLVAEKRKTGKTTVVTRLIKELEQIGFSVGVVKKR